MSDNKKSIDKEIKLYTDHLESLHSTLPFTMIFLQEAGEFFGAEFTKFITDNCEVEEIENDIQRIKVDPEHHKDYKKKSFNNRNLVMARRLVPRSFVVSMVSQYDAYLGRLLRALYLLKPETFNGSAKQFTFADISSFSSIEEFKDYAIEKEVESFLRDNHAVQFKNLENKFNIKLTRDLNVWPTFIELTERRNLFVHTDGRVSKQYLSICKEHGVDVSQIKEGDVLAAPQEYSLEAYKCLYEIGVQLGHVLWRKVLPTEIKCSDESIICTTYDLIERGEYDLACSILDSVLYKWKNKFSNEKNRLFLVINSAQAHKWAKREDKCKEIMSTDDWSVKEDKFKLADAVLKDDWDYSAKIMRKIGISEDFKDIYYRDWPLFKRFRKQRIFLDTYKDIYGRDFEIKISAKTFINTKINDMSSSHKELETELL